MSKAFAKARQCNWGNLYFMTENRFIYYVNANSFLEHTSFPISLPSTSTQGDISTSTSAKKSRTSFPINFLTINEKSGFRNGMLQRKNKRWRTATSTFLLLNATQRYFTLSSIPGLRFLRRRMSRFVSLMEFFQHSSIKCLTALLACKWIRRAGVLTSFAKYRLYIVQIFQWGGADFK